MSIELVWVLVTSAAFAGFLLGAWTAVRERT